MEYMAAQMDRQIEGAISENERLCRENDDLRATITALQSENERLRVALKWVYELWPKGDAQAIAFDALSRSTLPKEPHNER